MVSEPFAFRRGITLETNMLRLMTDSGEHVFEVFGVFYDYSTDQGIVLIGREIYDQSWEWNKRAQIQFANALFSRQGIFTER